MHVARPAHILLAFSKPRGRTTKRPNTALWKNPRQGGEAQAVGRLKGRLGTGERK